MPIFKTREAQLDPEEFTEHHHWRKDNKYIYITTKPPKEKPEDKNITQ